MSGREHRSLKVFRTVRSHMVERYIFNFRMRPDDLKKKLPVPWLEPQVVNGWCAVSFCILWLEKLALPPIPALFDLSTISCAYRIGVTDLSGDKPEPAVYVTDRWADLPLIAVLGPPILLDTIPVIKAAIGHDGDDTTHVQMSYVDGVNLFNAKVRPKHGDLLSEVFDSVDDFAAFIKKGVTSYGPSIWPDRFTKVDLHKEDVGYEPLEAEVDYSELHETWGDVEMVFDSAVRAKGARYQWTYRGLWSR